MLSIAVVEDTKEDTVLLCDILNRYQDETGQPVKVSTFASAEEFLYDYRPVYDVIFMDIMLPSSNGMAAAEKLRQIDSEVAIIFVTDMRQFAIQGYKVNAMDYFIKPASYFDVKLRLDKINLLKQLSLPAVVIHMPGQSNIAMSSDDIYYIEVMNKELTYHTRKGNYSTRSFGLRKLEQKLSDNGFCRCSSSYLVNLKWCRELHGNEITVGNDILKISRGMKTDFVTRLSETFTHLKTKGDGQ
ncbi:MAG: LytTR family DNA-binding domain-containing protein [Clostridia bacterium]|nr:LytTR family DNA-binding domain-containing protein [Clostridia bacterium]